MKTIEFTLLNGNKIGINVDTISTWTAATTNDFSDEFSKKYTDDTSPFEDASNMDDTFNKEKDVSTVILMKCGKTYTVKENYNYVNSHIKSYQ